MYVVAEGLQFPEGPVAMADGSIIFVELARGTLSRALDGGRVEVVAELGGSPNGAAVGPDGRIYVCNNGGVNWQRKRGHVRAMGNRDEPGRIEVVDPETGKSERLFDRCGDNLLRHPNDLVFDATGGFYFTDFGKTLGRTTDRGAIYYARADGSEIREVAFPLMGPNGIGLSPDGKTLYVAEGQTARVWAWEITAPGSLRKLRGREVAHGGSFVIGSANFQRFDSLAVSASGRILVGTLINGGISEIWPDGSMMRHHPFPDGHVTNICFGGPDLKTAYITLSGLGQLVAVDWHEPGHRLNYQQL